MGRLIDAGKVLNNISGMLKSMEDDSNVIEAELLGLHMRFEIWTEGNIVAE